MYSVLSFLSSHRNVLAFFSSFMFLVCVFERSGEHRLKRSHCIPHPGITWPMRDVQIIDKIEGRNSS